MLYGRADVEDCTEREEAGDGAVEDATGNRVQEHFATCHPPLSKNLGFSNRMFSYQERCLQFLGKKSFISPTLN